MSKFKKAVAFTIILCTLLSSMAGCDKTNNIDTGTTSAVTQEEITTQEAITENKEVIFWESEEVDISSLNPAPFDNWDFTDYSIYQHTDGQFYVHIKKWDVYRNIPELDKYNEISNRIDNHINLQFEETSASVSEETFSFAAYLCGAGEKSVQIITYHFNNHIHDVTLKSYILETQIQKDDDYYMINMYDNNNGSFFIIPEDYKIDDYTVESYQLLRYDTSDGGKTWIQAEKQDLGLNWNYTITLSKFITKEVGIISGGKEHLGRTWLTKDGGLTWFPISNVSVPYDDITRIGYSSLIDLKKCGDEYILTSKIDFMPHQNGNEELDFTAYIFYKSSDLINWTLCEPQ